MTYHACPLAEDEKVYVEGFTNAAWAQRVNLCIPLKDEKSCPNGAPGDKECYQWNGRGENAQPMTGGPAVIRTPKDPALAGAIVAEYLNDGGWGHWTDSTVNDASPLFRLGNFSQRTYITEDGGGKDQNDTCLFFRWFRGPVSETDISKVVFPPKKRMYVRAFTNTDVFEQVIKITLPGQSEPIVYRGHQEGMEPMEGPPYFDLGDDIDEDNQPKVEFFFVDKDGVEQPAFLSARRDDSLETIHQFTWLVRDEEATKHQTLVLCIYHWDHKTA